MKRKTAQSIQDGDTVYHKDIDIHGLDLVQKEKETGCISLLKLLVHLWTRKCQEQLGKIKAKIRLGNSAKVTFLSHYILTLSF